MAEEKKLFKVTIDNITVEVEPGTTVLQAARKVGGDVAPPAMCYYTKLKGSGGKCRTCLVEVSKGSTADPRPMPKLVASCRTTVMDGMEVKNITSERVIDARAIRPVSVTFRTLAMSTELKAHDMSSSAAHLRNTTSALISNCT
jgi:NADH-quinone oxidoreductase subunit G